MDVSQYLEIFLDETNEHLQNLNTQILELESDPENMDNINEIFRAAHSLKGMAGTMGYKRMQNLTHDMENVFSEVRNGNIKVKPEMIDVLFQCLDALEEYKNNIQETSDEGTNDNENLIKALNDILNGGKTEEAPAAKEEAPTATAPVAESGADGGEKWNDIAFDDSQIRVIKEAMKQGKNVYGINVVVQESCILKAARAFLVFKAVEEKGEIIVSMPSAQDVEDEKFDKDFTLIVLSDYSLDDIIKSAESVSEIAQVTGAVLELEKTKNYHAEEEAIEPAEEKKEAVAECIKAYRQIADFNEVVAVSALRSVNTDTLLDTVFRYLPYGPMYYDEDTVTDQPMRQIAAEMIREKALRRLQEEIPHGIAVTIEQMKERPDGSVMDIEASIICERESHKGIIIGKGGSMLKAIGSDARRDIEDMLEMKVNLKLFVKVRKDWRDSDLYMKNFGYHEDEK